MPQHAPKIQPVHIGHSHVADHHANGWVVIEQIQRLPNWTRRDSSVATLLELRSQCLVASQIVVDCTAHASGATAVP
mgnify:CR=1 FL=1